MAVPKTALCPECKKRAKVEPAYHQPGVYFFKRHFIDTFFGRSLCPATGLVAIRPKK